MDRATFRFFRYFVKSVTKGSPIAEGQRTETGISGDYTVRVSYPVALNRYFPKLYRIRRKHGLAQPHLFTIATIRDINIQPDGSYDREENIYHIDIWDMSIWKSVTTWHYNPKGYWTIPQVVLPAALEINPEDPHLWDVNIRLEESFVSEAEVDRLYEIVRNSSKKSKAPSPLP